MTNPSGGGSERQETRFCNDYGDQVGCLGTPDNRYTMRFDDIGEQPLLWCAFCGPQAHAMAAAINKAALERGEEFVKEFGDSITTLVKAQNQHGH